MCIARRTKLYDSALTGEQSPRCEEGEGIQYPRNSLLLNTVVHFCHITRRISVGSASTWCGRMRGVKSAAV